MIRKIFTIFFISTVLFAYSEDNTNAKGSKITGTIVDSKNNSPVEYATIGIYSDNDKLVTGGVTNSKGFFVINNLPDGTFSVKVTFMGYTTMNIPDVIVSSNKNTNLGVIELQMNTKEIDAVDVVAERSAIEYKIDKKVVNVSQHLTSISGSAVDVLENVPSVKVDIDGNVTLRGSGDFTVLIDGRPTILDPSDALEQIPAGTIENIEIITNPSAKYDPEGTAGILNIITKKNKLNGISGVISTSASNTGQYGANALFESRKEKFDFNIGLDYSKRNMPADFKFNRYNMLKSDSALHQNANGDFLRSRGKWNIKTGFNYNISEKDIFGINAGIGGFNMQRASTKEYSEWTDPAFNTSIYITDNNNLINMNFISGGLFYKHTFSKNNSLEVKATYNSRIKDQEETSYSFLHDHTVFEGKITGESGPSSSFDIQADYTKPIVLLNGKLEAGASAKISQREDNTSLKDYDTISNNYINQPQFNNTTFYKRHVYAGYGIVSGESGNFGYQGGLRMEYTFRTLEQVTNTVSTEISRPDFFPTIHTSYKLPADQQTTLSYTRRIKRPRGWFLEPHLNWMDANNVRQGNPDLLPEYINSFETGYQKSFGKGKQKSFVSAEAYYRITQNKTERIMKPWEQDNNILLHTFENVGTDFALGGELTLNITPVKWYTLNWMSDFYNYSLKINYDSISSFQSDFSWNTRINNTFKISKNTRIQVNGSYWSEKITAQGGSGSMFTVDAALKQDMLDRKLTASLQVSDIFGTRTHSFESFGDTFWQQTEIKPESPIIVLSLSYRINNYKPAHKGRPSESNGDSDGEGGF